MCTIIKLKNLEYPPLSNSLALTFKIINNFVHIGLFCFVTNFVKQDNIELYKKKQ